MNESGGFGLYIHWPFCQAKCPYCDFNSHVVASIDQDDWAAAFETEIDRVHNLTSERVLNSVFFGGGTPSLMNVSTVDRVMNRIQKRWRLANDLEVTLEANPTSIEAHRFIGYNRAGVNRVSIGVQALNDVDLKKLGRLHTAGEALRAIEVGRSVFNRISFDLIYARQDQSVRDWQVELKSALNLEPDHLSLYQLTIEDGTAFGDRFKRGTLRGLPSEDLGADLWDVTQTLCNQFGLPAYEVSNHARIGQESIHNQIYWKSGDWAGIGPGAHGRLTLGDVRHETIAWKAPGKWLSQVKKYGDGTHKIEALSGQAVLEERILMGLRLTEGIRLTQRDLEKLFNINMLCESCLLVQDGDAIQVTSTGMPLLNSVIGKLLGD